MSPTAIQQYLAGLEAACAFEIEELRRTPVEIKVRQLASLMACADLFEDEAEREAGVAEVRERWRLIRKGFRAR